MLLCRGSRPSSSRLLLHFLFLGVFSFPTNRPTDPKSENPFDSKQKKYKMALEIVLPNNTLSTSFLGPFPWCGKGKGPGTKVEHTVIYVLGQCSKKDRASFTLQVNVKYIVKKGRFKWRCKSTDVSALLPSSGY